MLNRRKEKFDNLGGRALAYFSRLSVQVLISLAIFIPMAFYLDNVYDGFERSNSVAAENSIWVVGQIEPSSLRFELALNKYIADPDSVDLEENVQIASEMLLGRLNVVSSHFKSNQLAPTSELMDFWGKISDYRPILTEFADSDPGMERRNAAIEIRDEVSDLSDLIRAFNVNAMQVAVDESARDRRNLIGMVNRFAFVAFIGSGFLLLVWWLLLYFWRKLSSTREKEIVARESLQKTYDLSSEGIIMLDRNSNVVMANPAAKEMFGLTRSDLEDPNLIDVLFNDSPEAAEARAYIDQMLATGTADKSFTSGDETYHLQFRSSHRSGTPIDLDILMARDRDHKGNPVLLAFIRDVTEQLAREQDLRDARDEAVRAVESRVRFFAAMSHEMRTPVSGAIAAIDAIKTRTVLEPEAMRLLNVADRSSQSALDQINNVLDLAWLERGEIQTENVPFNLVDVIQGAVDQYRPLAEGNGNEIELELPEHDESDLEGPLRVFMRPLNNLLSNAIKHTRDGTISVRAAILGGQVRVEVEDTGAGISREFHERIFEPFEMGPDSGSRTATGTGLGLPIARRAVESLGGKIGVSSTPGLGSQFWFTAKIKRAQPGTRSLQQAGRLTPSERRAAPVLRILLVEDNEASRVLAEEMLEWYGQVVTTAENGKEAVALAAETEFDVILMDVNMPVMGGTEATREIRSGGASKDARIIGVTAFGAPDEIKEFRSCGMNMVLPKPLTSKDIDQVVGVTSDRPTARIRDVASLESITNAMESLSQESRSFLDMLDNQGSNDADAIKDEAHKLKGLSAMLDLNGLSTAFKTIELSAAKNDLNNLPTQKDVLRSEIEAAF